MEITEAVARLIGAAGGAIVGIVFIWPQTRREAASRFLVSMIAGALLEPHIAWYLKIPDATDMTMGTAAMGAALSWWVMGATVRLIRYGKQNEDGPKP